MNDRAVPVLAETEFRSTGKGHTFTGYAALFDSASEAFSGEVIETVAAGAFRRSLIAPSRKTFVVDHDDARLLASTTGHVPLRLSEDSRGLLNEAELPDTSYVRDLRELHDRGELSGMSFEFAKTKGGVTYGRDGKSRRLTDVKLFHTTVLAGLTPRYPGTMAEIRALAEAVSARPEDVDAIIDALRAQRRLDADEMNLLERVVVQVAPVESRWSSAASDASSATYALSSVLSLLGNETDDDAQATLLRTAADALQSFITAESAEIGTEADKAASASGIRSTPNLEAARAILAPKA
jgi:hypothetical protein